MRARFKFQEGQLVAIKEDYPALGLKAGDTGVVWAMYPLEPPTYEVTFRGPDGEPFDVTVTEEELVAEELSTSQAAQKSSERQVEAA